MPGVRGQHSDAEGLQTFMQAGQKPWRRYSDDQHIDDQHVDLGQHVEQRRRSIPQEFFQDPPGVDPG